jgi:iron complex outermembrane receptor protein
MKHLIIAGLCLLSSTAYAQRDTLYESHNLDEVSVHAYEWEPGSLQYSSSSSLLTSNQLQRFNNTNVLPALNTIPGVRMEERSPGSYRLNIRGSSLRAPFGVRNVKIYYNGIPFTDPGGTSYFNQLGFHNFGSMEVIKGPGGSMYGAGTGGVLLIDSKNDKRPGVEAGYTAGSYGLQHIHGELKTGKNDVQNVIRYQHLASDGYRDHTAMRRDAVSWDAVVRTSGRNQLSANFLYSDLYYQTPGGLTLAEYTADHRAARPAVGAFPGAEQNKAAIYAQSFLAGFTNKYKITSHLRNTTTVYGMYSQLRNPAIQNYGKNTEPHFGGRTVFKYRNAVGRKLVMDWVSGAEAQQGFAYFKTYKNVKGNPDSLRIDDEVNNRQLIIFTQIAATHNRWTATGGLSLNNQRLEFARLSTPPYNKQVRSYDNQLMPRVGLLFILWEDGGSNVKAYTNAAKGFSPPTTQEILPTGGSFNNNLQAEKGWNYELGINGHSYHGLSYDINAFYFKLDNTIVVRRDAGGGNYFVNAGYTKQAGVEVFTSYTIPFAKKPSAAKAGQNDMRAIFATTRSTSPQLKSISGGMKLWLSYTYYQFRYGSFMQNTTDFSNKYMPGVAPHNLTAGVDFSLRRFAAFVTHNYMAKIPLDDANTAYAKSYNLLSCRVAYRFSFAKKYRFELFAGGENLLNEKYSLGNDINAFGGRYYNAAPGISFFGGLTTRFTP